jgi:formate hydrogenlyase transcriptional activator
MSFADRWEPFAASANWLHTGPRRYALAVVAVGFATLLRYALGFFLGLKEPFILFYPTIMAVALLAGFRAGFVATLISAIAGECLFQDPYNSFAVRDAGTVVGPLLFILIGIAISVFVDVFRRHTKSLRLFWALLDQLNEAVEILDPETLRFLDVNQRACKDLGYSREELLSMTFPDINPCGPALRAPVREKLLADGPVLRESVHRRKDGSTFPVETSLKLIELGRTYAVAVSRDITKRKRAEAALREEEDRYRDLVENSEDLVCTHDLEGRLLSVNAAPARILGYEVDELLKIPMRELIASEGRQLFDAYLERLRATSEPESGLLYVTAKSGEIRTWEFHNTLRTEGVVKPIVRGMAHDITERRRAELARRGSEERYRLLFEKNIAGVALASRDGRVLDCNQAWTRMLGYESVGEIRGRATTDFYFNIADRQPLVDDLAMAGIVSGRELQLRRKDGTGVWVLVDCIVFATDDGMPMVQTTAIDITERKRAEELIRRRLREDKEKLAREKSYLEGEIETELGFEQIIGQSLALREVLKKARIVAPTDSTVLLLGETGTGKELVARSVHSLSGRRDNTFVKLNCAAVPSGLLESELFGHEKGAFTGAVSKKVGRIELADKGTLFLDEIGELPPELQPKLLRVLQDREFERLGGVQTVHVDVRIISATNRDLRQDVADKKFREDLFYRLNVFPIELPPLRDRREDIPALVHHFVHKHSSRMRKQISEITEEAMLTLRNWSWPGNVRELENMIERMVILTKGRELAAPPDLEDTDEYLDDDNLNEMEREHIIRVLRETNGVLSGSDGAASRLGIKRTTLQSRMKRLGIEAQEYRRGTPFGDQSARRFN